MVLFFFFFVKQFGESFYLYAFLPYVLLLANFYELGFSTDSLYFDGIMVWKKNIMSSFLYLRVIIFIVLSFIYFVFTILLLPNNAIFLSFFSVLMVTSMVSLLNFYVYSQRWDIMVNGKPKSKYTLASFLSYLLAVILLILIHYVKGKSQLELYGCLLLSLITLVIFYPLTLRIVRKKIIVNRYKLMQGFRGQ